MLIKQATRENTDAVLSCFQELNKCGISYFSKKRTKSVIDKYCVAMAVQNLRVWGACAIKLDNTVLEIFAIAVVPDGQGYGVGRKLLGWAEIMAKETDLSVVIAHSYEFYGARPFYQKLGYTEIEKKDTKEGTVLTFAKIV